MPYGLNHSWNGSKQSLSCTSEFEVGSRGTGLYEKSEYLLMLCYVICYVMFEEKAVDTDKLSALLFSVLILSYKAL